MSAEKGDGSGVVDVLLGGNHSLITQLEQYNRYALEVAALERKLSQNSVRQPTRQARLTILRKRLMPQLQAKIEGP